MKFHDAGYPYWSIDVPGLDEDDAKELVQLAGERSGNGGEVIDPRYWLTFHMDRETVEMIANSLRKSGDGMVQNLLEEMEEWLSAPTCSSSGHPNMIKPDWTSRGKSVAQLIKELGTFENQELEVRISVDHGETSYPISLVGMCEGKYALLENCQDTPTVIHHNEKV